MGFGQYSLELDRTGFPLVRRKDWGAYISLFPVCVHQMERFLIGHGPKGGLYTEAWYRNVLCRGETPRKPWKELRDQSWLQFVTGLRAEDLGDFFGYQGAGYRLPTAQERLALLSVSEELGNLRSQLLEAVRSRPGYARPAVAWLNAPDYDYTFTQEGLPELVTTKQGVRFIGRPWQGLHPNSWEPTRIGEFDWEIFGHKLGFRLARSA